MKMSNNPAKYEALIKQYLRSILDIHDYTMASYDSNFGEFFFFCSVFNLNNKNVNALIARELS